MKKEIILLPNVSNNVKIMGEQIRLARLRRNLSMEVVASRASITRPTLMRIEKGSPNVSIGAIAKVLKALGGLDTDLLKIAKDDETGRMFQDLQLKVCKRGKNE